MSLELVSNNPDVKTTAHPDVSVSDLGTLSSCILWTPEAHAWVEDNLELEPWQRQSMSCVIEHGYIDTVIGAMESDGLEVEHV